MQTGGSHTKALHSVHRAKLLIAFKIEDGTGSICSLVNNLRKSLLNMNDPFTRRWVLNTKRSNSLGFHKFAVDEEGDRD